MNNSIGNLNVDQVISQMRTLAQNSNLPEIREAPTNDFSTVLKNSVDQVNQFQSQASALKQAYEVGDTNVDIPEVMIAIQKASLSFEATTEVRNKLLNAYQEIMNMPV